MYKIVTIGITVLVAGTFAVVPWNARYVYRAGRYMEFNESINMIFGNDLSAGKIIGKYDRNGYSQNPSFFIADVYRPRIIGKYSIVDNRCGIGLSKGWISGDVLEDGWIVIDFSQGLSNGGIVFYGKIKNGVLSGWMRREGFSDNIIDCHIMASAIIDLELAQQVDSAEASTIAVPPSEPSGSPR